MDFLTVQIAAAAASLIVSIVILFKPLRKCFFWVWYRTFGKTVYLLKQHIIEEDETLKRIEKELTTNGGNSIRDILEELRERHFSFEAYLNAQMNVQKIALFRTDASGRVVAHNRYHQRLVGFSFEEIKGDGWVNVLHPDDRTRVHDLWLEAVEENREFSEDIKYVKPSGEAYRVHVDAYREIDRTGKIRGYLGVVTLLNA